MEGSPHPLLLRPIAQAPAAFVVEDFASREECAGLAAVGYPLLQRSKVAGHTSNVRTSSSAKLLHMHLDKPVVRVLLQRVAALVGIEGVQPSGFELQMVRYAEGEQVRRFVLVQNCQIQGTFSRLPE